MSELYNFLVNHIILIVLVISGIIWFFWYLSFSEFLRIPKIALIPIIIILLIFGTLSAIGFAQFEKIISYTHIGANLRIFGPILLMWAVNLLIAKIIHRSPRMLCDIYTPALALSLMLARINCFITGCCYGLPVPGKSFTYPIREIEIVFQLIMIISLARRAKQKRFDGTLYPIYMISYGVFRFVLEYFRPPENLLFGSFRMPHLWSIISVVAGLIIYVILKKKLFPIQEKDKKKRRKN